MSKHAGLLFLDHLFKTRNYNLDTKYVQFLRGSNMCKITIEDSKKCIILCLIISNENTVDSDTVFEDKQLKYTSNKKRNFIKTILQHGKECHASEIVLVSDSITSHAVKEMSNSLMGIVHFTFAEINAIKINKHDNQPLNFRKLSSAESTQFKKHNPHHKRELFQFSNFDAIVKLYGFRINDIITFQDHDADIGFVTEYGIVTEKM
jgi:hypothetical protein